MIGDFLLVVGGRFWVEAVPDFKVLRLRRFFATDAVDAVVAWFRER